VNDVCNLFHADSLLLLLCGTCLVQVEPCRLDGRCRLPVPQKQVGGLVGVGQTGQRRRVTRLGANTKATPVAEQHAEGVMVWHGQELLHLVSIPWVTLLQPLQP
jgi:hypothetical protein